MIFTCHAKRPETWALQKCLDAEVKTICVMCTITCVRHQQSILAFFFLLHSDIVSIPCLSSQQPALTAAPDLCLWAPLPLTYKNLVPAGDLVAWELDYGICISLILCPNLAFAYSFSYSAVNRCLLHAESIVLGDGCEHGTAFRLIDVHI